MVYVGTTLDTVYKSVDGGRTWTTGTGIPPYWGYAVAVDRSQPNTVYASTSEGGVVYRSTDAGATWQRLRVGSSTGPILEILSGPGGAVYVGLEANGVFHSPDRGTTWVRRITGLAASDVRSLLVVPSTPSTVYAGTYGDGVYRTTNEGHTWNRRGLTGRTVNDLSMHPSASQVVYAASDRGVHKTTDGGLTWSLVTSGVVGVRGVAVAPSNPSIVYAVNWAGVIKSVDAGQTWQSLNVPGYVAYVSVAVHPTNPNVAWVGAQTLTETVLRTGDGGKTWLSGNACPMHYAPLDITVDVRNPAVVYAGCQGNGVYRSVDGGATWTHITPLVVANVTSVVIDPTNSQRLYIGTYSGDGVSGVFRSLDRGVTWSPFIAGMTTTWIHSLAMTPGATAVHAGTTAYGLGGAGGGVFTYPLQ